MQALERHALLRHRVAVAHRDGAVLERVEVDRDAERRADLVLAAVAAADRAGVVEVDVPARRAASAATSRAIGESCSLRDSGSTATLTGARRGSSLSTVRVSVPPFAFGTSSSRYASTRNAIIARVRPNDGSITYGMYRSPLAWSKYDRLCPEASVWLVRS